MRVCIVGAGDGGAIAALQARRVEPNCEVKVFSKRQELGCPPCEMPLVLGGRIARWEELVRGLRSPSFYEKRQIEIHTGTAVTDVLRREKTLVAAGVRYSYDKLILALGGIPSVPCFPGMDGQREFVLSTDMADGVALDRAIGQYGRAAIVGGGSIGLELAEALKLRGYEEVYLVVRRDVLRAQLDDDMSQTVRDVLSANGVQVRCPASIKGMWTTEHGKRVRLEDDELEAGFVFFATGSRPNVELARNAGLAIGESEGIVVNEYLQTSDPDIYAVGDCMENWDAVTGSRRLVQLCTNAIRNGYIAGRNAAGGNSFRYAGSVMPFVTQVFGHQIGSVGLTEREAQERGLEVVSVRVTTPRLRRRFDGRPAHYKLVADRRRGTLVGAQVISEEIVSGTIDKLAVGIAAHMPLDRLVQVDSCYSPHVQEDQVAVPLQRLLGELGR